MHRNRIETFAPLMPAAPTALHTTTGLFFLALLVYGTTAQWQALEALSTFGIANAIMLGLLTRVSAWREWRSYVAIGIASWLASWMHGTGGAYGVMWAIADLSGVLMGVLLLARLPLPVLQLRRENSPLLVLLACLAASAVTTLLRTPVLVSHWDDNLAKAWTLALSTEFMNHALVVPVVLAFRTRLHRHRSSWGDVLPLAALLASEVLATFIGGPGAIAFTLPAFIWCALRYPLFITATVFALFTVWKCHAFVAGHSSMTSAYFSDIESLRVGLSLLWLGPLTVACSHASRNEVLQRLNYASQHDHLTSALVRRTFVQRSEALITRLRSSNAPMALLMLDIDHFKQVNDLHGHAMGDSVLQGFSATVSRQLRQSDLLGRYGGEEFCVCLPAISLSDALLVAERLRAAVLTIPFATPQGTPLHITVSLGLVHYAAGTLPATVDVAMAQADAMLYRAKTGGRNRVEYSSMTPPAAEASLPDHAVDPAPACAITQPAPEPVKG